MSSLMRDPARASGPRPRGRPGYDRETVLRRSVELFNRHGYDATSMGDLAKDLGIGKSALYHHFESKESILAAALDEALREISSVVEHAQSSDEGSPYERLRTTIQKSVHILAAHLPAATLLLRVRGNSELEQRALAQRRRLDAQLARLVRDAAAEGRLRRDIDPDLISRLVFGMVNSLVEWFHPDGAVDAETLAATVADVIFDGLDA